MNKIVRTLIAGLVMAATTVAMAQPKAPHAHPHEGPHEEMHDMAQPPMHAPHGAMALGITAQKVCYMPHEGLFAIIDSIDCAVDLVVRHRGEMVRVGRYQTDNIHKRHDLSNILRPKSVAFAGDKIVFLASAQVDSSYIGVLSLQADADGNLPLIACRKFSCHSDAFSINPRELVVVGFNAVGYDLTILPLFEGIEGIGDVAADTFHYNVPRQSERIRESDPIGIGLTVVAVSVVFLALLCIALILQGSSKLFAGLEKKEKGGKEKKGTASKAPAGGADDEVMAAIAAALHLYNEELHDDEQGVITIQKVEREWTPWNAKYYNMNHYFNNRK